VTYVQLANLALVGAYNGMSKLTPEVLALPGMSSARGRHLLNNLCAFNEARYLEVGPWKGSTLISALYGHNLAYHAAVENYTEAPAGVRDELLANCAAHLGPSFVVNLVERDCFSFDPVSKGITGINVYFYDGSHTRDAQYRALAHYWASLADEFVLVVDDYAWKHVRQATQAALVDVGATVLFSAVLSDVLDEEVRDIAPGDVRSPVTGLPVQHVTTVYPEGWHNGMYLAVCKKGRT
jgi:hypothetical protein